MYLIGTSQRKSCLPAGCQQGVEPPMFDAEDEEYESVNNELEPAPARGRRTPQQ